MTTGRNFNLSIHNKAARNMRPSLLTINTTVPTEDRNGTPVIVFFDNGDWEIVLQGEVDAIEEGTPSFLGSVTFIDFFIGLMVLFDIGDADDLDVSDEVAYLAISETVIPGGEDEPVLLIWDDGETDVMERGEAEGIIDSDPDQGRNFITALELFEDYRHFSERHRDAMFGETVEDDLDEDAEPEEI